MIKFPREQRSLFGEILDWMLAPLLLVWPMSVALTWVVAQNIASQPYDRELGEIARTLARRVVDVQKAKPGGPRVRLDINPLAAEFLRRDDVDRVYFQILGPGGELVAGDRDLPVPAAGFEPGEVHYRDATILDEEVRVAALWLPADDTTDAASAQAPSRALVQVAETLGKRSQLANDIIKGVIFPQFVILPLAVLLTWFALWRGMRPLNDLQRRIRQRESQDLSPIDGHDVPEEVSPLVASINDLLARLDASIGRQKHFLADAAHQLKTPLAGLRMQAELAQREIDGGDTASARRSMQQIARSSQRAAHMVNQLLSMARAEDEEQHRRVQDINLLRLAEDTVRDFYGRASDKRIDLGLEAADAQAPLLPAWIRGHPLLVRELIRNLVDNAILYTPAGGRVTVRVLTDAPARTAVVQVEDDGPGVPAGEREAIFQPFYRPADNPIEGSGLGLAIVREIAQQHGASVAVDDARVLPAQALPAVTPGAKFTVRFPAAAAPGPAPP